MFSRLNAFFVALLFVMFVACKSDPVDKMMDQCEDVIERYENIKQLTPENITVLNQELAAVGLSTIGNGDILTKATPEQRTRMEELQKRASHLILQQAY